MAKVYLSERERICAKLASWVYGQMRVCKVTQAELAERLGISQQAVSRKLKTCQFTYDDFLTFVKMFNPSQNDLLWLISYERREKE